MIFLADLAIASLGMLGIFLGIYMYLTRNDGPMPPWRHK